MCWDRNTRLSLALLGPAHTGKRYLGAKSHSVTQDVSEPIPAQPKNQYRKAIHKEGVKATQGVRAAPSSTPSAGTLIQNYTQSPQGCVSSSQGTGEDRSHGKSLEGVSWQRQEALQGENKASKALLTPTAQLRHQGRASGTVQGSKHDLLLGSNCTFICSLYQLSPYPLEIRRAMLGSGSGD